MDGSRVVGGGERKREGERRRGDPYLCTCFRRCGEGWMEVTCADLARTQKMRAFHISSSLSPVLLHVALRRPKSCALAIFWLLRSDALMQPTGLGSGIREIYEISRMEESRRRFLHHGRRRREEGRLPCAVHGDLAILFLSLTYIPPLPSSYHFLPSPFSSTPYPPCPTTRQTHVTCNPIPRTFIVRHRVDPTIRGKAMVRSTPETPPTRLCFYRRRFHRFGLIIAVIYKKCRPLPTSRDPHDQLPLSPSRRPSAQKPKLWDVWIAPNQRVLRRGANEMLMIGTLLW
jgi:hypothetical protein